MFSLLGIILRPSIEPKEDYLITSALRDPGALTIVGINPLTPNDTHIYIYIYVVPHL
jgi:hypothetical protein